MSTKPQKNRLRKTIIVGLLFFALLITGCSKKGIPANEWILSRYETLSVLNLYCQNMDQIVYSYLSGISSEEEYLESLGYMQMEMDKLLAIKENTEETIRVGTHSEETKTGENGYQNLWKDLKTLTDSLVSDKTLLSNNELTYFYMGYRESIRKDISDYMVGYSACGGVSSQEEGREDNAG